MEMKFALVGLLGAAVATGACSSAEIGDGVGTGDAGVGLADAAPQVDAGPGTPDAANVPDATPPADAAPCDDGLLNTVDPLGGGCYMYFAAPVQWETARDRCANLLPPAHLAVITSAEENAAVAAIAAPVADVWLGANDRAVESIFVWDNGEPFGYDNWRDGEPNDGTVDGEDCAVMELDNGGTWDDRNCVIEVYGFLCER